MHRSSGVSCASCLPCRGGGEASECVRALQRAPGWPGFDPGPRARRIAWPRAPCLLVGVAPRRRPARAPCWTGVCAKKSSQSRCYPSQHVTQSPAQAGTHNAGCLACSHSQQRPMPGQGPAPRCWRGADGLLAGGCCLGTARLDVAMGVVEVRGAMPGEEAPGGSSATGTCWGSHARCNHAPRRPAARPHRAVNVPDLQCLLQKVRLCL
jgi:hypothetical protein